MADELFWSIVKKFNALMKSSIIGPNCIDPSICKGDCCSIKIDVPKVLAKEYIKRGYAYRNDFIRGNVFSFKLRFDEKKGKCFFFDKEINGCSVHNSGIKPPQCWIYPTNFSHPKNKEISCKRAKGWKIIDFENTNEAEELLKKYVFLCQLEKRTEIKAITKRIGIYKSVKSKKIISCLKKALSEIAPSQLGGFKDSWDRFKILPAEGISLQLKKFCNKYAKKCEYITTNYLDCKNICDKIVDDLIKFLHHNLCDFVKKGGLDINGEYPLYKLFEFAKNEEN